MSRDGVSYHILGVLGEGGFGKVYRARMQTESGFSKEVAIKVLHNESPPRSLLKQFRDEARILGLLRDRAIVGVEPPVQLGGRWAVVMDFIDGKSCSRLLEDGMIPAGVAIEIVEEIARALHNAYNQAGPNGEPLQLLHRDIKPENINVTPSGDVYLLDFGIAKANFEEREFKTKQAFGGTPGYIAPERLERIEDPKGDVFSLGVTLHEMITGMRPKYAAPTILFDADEPAQDLEELEVPDHFREDPEVRKILELAGWMRTYEYGQRPTAREVEGRCRALRREMEVQSLREWAEANVPAIGDLEQDERSGTTLTTRDQREASPTLAPAATPAPAPVQPSGNAGLAIGAVLGGGGVVLLGALSLVAVLLGVIGWMAMSPPTPPAPAPEPTLVVVPEPEPTADPEPAEPVAEPVADPESVADPTPKSPKPAPVVIKLPGPGASPSPTPSPQPSADPTPSPDPSPERPTGLVVVKTIPSGASVKLKGQTLTKSGAGYKLAPGTHVLQITSTAGESTSIPVQVKVGGQVDICYSFDTNSKCGQ